jgi:hypothetical protein
VVAKKSKSRVQVKCPKCDEVFLPSIEEKQSRAGKAARRKGANFERNLAKKFEKWWNYNEKYNYEFRRSPQSGGSILKDGFDMAGDLCSNAPDWYFHVEAKNAPSSFTGLHNFFSEKAAVHKWWEQAIKDCPNHRVPLLIINRFDQPTFCVACCLNRTTSGFYIAELLQNEMKFEHLMFNPHYEQLAIWTLKEMLESDSMKWR